MNFRLYFIGKKIYKSMWRFTVYIIDIIKHLIRRLQQFWTVANLNWSESTTKSFEEFKFLFLDFYFYIWF